MNSNVPMPTGDCNSRRLLPYSIDPETDFYTAGLIFSRLEAEYQAARVRAGIAL